MAVVNDVNIDDPRLDPYRPQIDIAARTVGPTFRLFGWTWLGAEPPTENEVADTFAELLLDLLNDSAISQSARGRLVVSRHSDGYDFFLDLN